MSLLVVGQGDHEIFTPLAVEPDFGNTALGPNETGALDVVAMDDFIYAEPTAVPEPSSLVMAGLALVLGGGAWLRKRARVAG